MIRGDFHVHTTHCDGKHTPREMVEAALSRGMTHLGFSAHSPMAFSEDYTLRDMTDYYREIRALQAEYRGRITIYCGMEKDLYSPMDTADCDYIVGSVHYVQKDGEYLVLDLSKEHLSEGVDRLFGGDWYALAEAYYAAVAQLWKLSPAIIGHFDLITKYNEGGCLFDEHHPRYVAAARAAIDALIPYGIPFEINTGAIFRGYRTAPYPAPQLLAYIAQCGGTAILSGDVHHKDGLELLFDECRALAAACHCPLVALPKGLV
ncbi:MAG: histidinol-phosphatase HisJ family protein [Ruminococcaceae bacterium]|nr:histidinol-phosphatase HisJ family protein [Oscillospiraceae bacterium]